MKRAMLVGVVLIGLGVSMLIYQGATLLIGKATGKIKPEPVGKDGYVDPADEKDVIVPATAVLGTIFVGAGVFSFVLGSGRQKQKLPPKLQPSSR